ncbi:uncharacterized protein EAF01_003644 [Botrytis porri]|uniref:Uncharacterized protein n=1 Tax=Botrytis porri TaxID=87229 RepID=A0A4Z1KRW0_9HELO|nr:uncharacterized protein EAF01_003644 [Botrytis porri]KAF7909926.1 hypothetical protein EAF01_003644 [Botrytis porri]TGO84985.1 hypothetical protein BPOR_0443g00010 [Botrytis porri]
MAAKPIFTASDDVFLMQRNLLKPALHRRRLVSSSISQSVSLSSSDSGLSEDSGVDTKDFTMIPEFLETAEIWNKWKVIQETEQEQGTIFEVDFLQQALGHIPRQNFEDSSSDWEEYMRGWGISEELIDAIIDVEFTDVTDTIEIRYLSLERIKRESDQRTRNNHTFNPSIASIGVPRYSRVPGLQTLFKAISTDRLRYKDGKIHVGSLVSEAATDFRGYGAALCFTPDYKVADRYRRYIRRRINTSPPLIIQLALPNAWIEGLPPRAVEFGDLWKKVVHTCRQGYNMTGEMKFIHNLPLIIAPIAHSPNKAIARLDTWQEVSIQHVMKIEGQETLPVQYVFQGDDNLEEIGQVGELKVVT